MEWFWAVVFAVRCLQSPKLKKKTTKTAISCPGMSQNVPNGQIRCPVHMLVQIQWIWFGVSWSSSFCCALFTLYKVQNTAKSLFLAVSKSKFAGRSKNKAINKYFFILFLLPLHSLRKANMGFIIVKREWPTCFNWPTSPGLPLYGILKLWV